ncbi:MAG: hypothetical protein GX121_07415 [Ignavibacteria bacterium]|nr:hypothetical protein [Ignavibacteria bacterium]
MVFKRILTSVIAIVLSIIIVALLFKVVFGVITFLWHFSIVILIVALPLYVIIKKKVLK